MCGKLAAQSMPHSNSVLASNSACVCHAGGETLILQPQLLNSFWQAFQPGKGLELTDLAQLVPSPYGQLTVFDPRLPHGVRPVSGTRDPQQVR